jgi:hypothetical protein
MSQGGGCERGCGTMGKGPYLFFVQHQTRLRLGCAGRSRSFSPFERDTTFGCCSPRWDVLRYYVILKKNGLSARICSYPGGAAREVCFLNAHLPQRRGSMVEVTVRSKDMLAGTKATGCPSARLQCNLWLPIRLTALFGCSCISCATAAQNQSESKAFGNSRRNWLAVMTRPAGTLSSWAFDDGGKKTGCQSPAVSKHLRCPSDPERVAQPRSWGSGLGSALLFYEITP